MAKDELLTVAEIAAVLKINHQPAGKWLAGTLPALHVRRRVRVRRAHFAALLGRERARAGRPRRPGPGVLPPDALAPAPGET